MPGLSHRFHAEMTLVLFGLRFGDCVLNRTSATDAIHFPRGEAGTFKSHWEGVQTLRAGNRNLRFPWGVDPVALIPDWRLGSIRYGSAPFHLM